MSAPPAMHARPTPVRPQHRGVALVIVLAFVVLLSGLILAFFTRAIGDRQVASGSAGQSKVDLFAQGALDSIMGDLRQEMAAGAASPAPSPLPAGTTWIAPRNGRTATLSRVGSDNSLPNLVKRSASGQDFFPSNSDYNVSSTTGFAPSNRASGVATTRLSANGRSISLARWNSHYLLPKKNQDSKNDTDATPADSFTAPDWIMVSRDGSNPKTTALSSLRDATAMNTAFVVGRYAYAIYDEGGLLDMNVAGYPSGATALQTGAKPAVAYADLTQIGLTQSQIDQIVGWRNNASAAPTGAFPSFMFNAVQAKNYYDFVTGNWRSLGFLTVGNLPNGPAQTDRSFSSRQSLMRFLVQGLGGSGTDATAKTTRAALQNALQYMGTFSRDLTQPSFSPNAGLPKVQSAASSNGTFGRGNDAYGTDRYNTDPTLKSPYDINPPFPAVRVITLTRPNGTPFVRADGTTPVIGDPLMKCRFPLSRLALVLRSDTSCTSKDDSNPIYRNFGLYRPAAKGPWLYDHGDSGGILRLSYPSGGTTHQGVAQEGREPDFFELLKAAINVGSIGKSLTNPSPDASCKTIMANQYSQDVLTAQQILQIGANIIDQYDKDSYPTQIVFAGFATDPNKVVSGVEDLPYIYHIRNRMAFVDNQTGRWLMQPVLWNPHDWHSGTPTGGPTAFRVRAVPVDSTETETFSVTYNHSGPAAYPVTDFLNPTQNKITFNIGSNPNLNQFRQPTLLGEANIPAGTNISCDPVGKNFNQANVDPTMTLVGILNTQFDLKVPGSTNQYGLQAQFVGPPSGIQFVLEYQDENGVYSDPPYNSFIHFFYSDGNNTRESIFYSTCGSDAQATAWLNGGGNNYNSPTRKAIDSGGINLPYTSKWLGTTRPDPRTSRWSTSHAEFANAIPCLDMANNLYSTHRGGTAVSLACHQNNPDDKGIVGAGGYNSQRWWRDNQFAYRAENNLENTYQTETESEYRRFIRDPDGFPRRAMGGYADDKVQGAQLDPTTGQQTSPTGLPLADMNYASRPLILNRAFRSVAELGYAYTGTAWKNLSFSFPESGNTALLDVFCLDEISTPSGMVAGQVDLNTRQVPVLQALFSKANVDTADDNQVIPSDAAGHLAAALVNRTTNILPIASRAELVGTLAKTPTTATLQEIGTAGTTTKLEDFFTGFATDIGKINEWKNGNSQSLITRQRESAIRALADTGAAQTWNLLIDLVAQSGRFSPNATTPDQFNVEAERRYWLHVAIDRATGTVIDQKIEAVNE